MNKNKQNPFNADIRNGFTLIEILLVVTIIATIATAMIYSYNTAKTRGRDARRKEDLKKIQAALFLYSKAHGGFYPSCINPQVVYFSYFACDLDHLTYHSGDNLTNYINPIPIEPGLKSNSVQTGGYTNLRYHYFGKNNVPDLCNTNNTCTNFNLVACLENENDKEKDTGGIEEGCEQGNMHNAPSFTLSAPN